MPLYPPKTRTPPKTLIPFHPVLDSPSPNLTSTPPLTPKEEPGESASTRVLRNHRQVHT